MKTKHTGTSLFSALLCAAIAIPCFVEGKAADIKNVPNGKKFSCALCHADGKKSSDNLTKFGKDYLANVKKWDAALSGLGDGSGPSYGAKLGDPNGTWKKGDPDPALK